MADHPRPLAPGQAPPHDQIQHVQNFIEHCLQRYLPKHEVISLLHTQYGTEPGFSQLVWEKLEEQNAEFFRMYRLRLRVREQVLAFNKLVEQHLTLVAAQAAPAMMETSPTAASGAARADTEGHIPDEPPLEAPQIDIDQFINLVTPKAGSLHESVVGRSFASAGAPNTYEPEHEGSLAPLSIAGATPVFSDPFLIPGTPSGQLPLTSPLGLQSPSRAFFNM